MKYLTCVAVLSLVAGTPNLWFTNAAPRGKCIAPAVNEIIMGKPAVAATTVSTKLYRTGDPTKAAITSWRGGLNYTLEVTNPEAAKMLVHIGGPGKIAVGMAPDEANNACPDDVKATFFMTAATNNTVTFVVDNLSANSTVRSKDLVITSAVSTAGPPLQIHTDTIAAYGTPFTSCMLKNCVSEPPATEGYKTCFAKCEENPSWTKSGDTRASPVSAALSAVVHVIIVATLFA